MDSFHLQKIIAKKLRYLKLPEIPYRNVIHIIYTYVYISYTCEMFICIYYIKEQFLTTAPWNIKEKG